MVDRERLIRLLDRVRRDRQRLAALGADLSEADLDAVKYRFITLIEGAARIAHHLAVSEGWGAPDTNATAFTELAQRRVLDGELASRLAAASGFRNVLVHQYTEVDDDRVVANLHRLGDFDAFVDQVGRWLVAQDE